MNRNKVILVNNHDIAIGEMDKMEAHYRGELHRAFSIFVFNGRGEMLIHQRAQDKYHGAGLWTNACCSHPQPGEELYQSVQERLLFEMGLKCPVQKAFSFIYHTPVENGLIEHEYDHVFIGYTDNHPEPNPAEVQDHRWVLPAALREEITTQPERYTFWFKEALPMVLNNLRQ